MITEPSWVFFDVDQTLCDFTTMMRRALSASALELQRRWPQLAGRYQADDLEEIRNRLAEAYGDRPVPNVAVRRETFAILLAEVGADDQAIDEVTEHFLAIRYADPIIFDDVVPTLEALSGQLRLGVITNGNSKLDSLGLQHYFSAEFVAEEIGFAKPDRRLYQHAAAAVGADPGELIMVGDTYEKDVEPPRSLGWQAFWLRRGRARQEPYELSSLADLPKLIIGRD